MAQAALKRSVFEEEHVGSGERASGVKRQLSRTSGMFDSDVERGEPNPQRPIRLCIVRDAGTPQQATSWKAPKGNLRNASVAKYSETEFNWYTI
jgi:hypothetical protein